MKLSASFYERKDVVKIARELLGKALFTNIRGVITGGLIVETEAYSYRERGCHAFGSKMTSRNAVMFGSGGHAYVYLCYGMHHLFNVVTNEEGVAEAVLIRSLQPLVGAEEMSLRRNNKGSFQLTSGPGKLSKALGIDRTFNGKSLLHDDVWIEESGMHITKKQIVATPRIGIDYAGEDAKLPWRFTITGNPWISH
ncbi:MAG: DNA-3-methyladenine glycosylase [Cyclobacteriaceae bacterium]|nr:DNA-3-methyladenine glycosylase [Cyclobacteriaceae bacterium]